MTWAEALAVFNFITWFLPIAIRSYFAWRLGRASRNNVDPEELGSIGESIKRANIGSQKIKFDD